MLLAPGVYFSGCLFILPWAGMPPLNFTEAFCCPRRLSSTRSCVVPWHRLFWGCSSWFVVFLWLFSSSSCCFLLCVPHAILLGGSPGILSSMSLRFFVESTGFSYLFQRFPSGFQGSPSTFQSPPQALLVFYDSMTFPKVYGFKELLDFSKGFPYIFQGLSP